MLNQALQQEQAALESERCSLEKQIVDAETRLKYVQKRLSLVVGLLDESNGTDPADKPYPEPETSPAVEVAYQVLAERNGETMHYKPLAQEVIARNGDLSGNNAAQILVARLVNDDRFVRPARRGFYGLRQDYPKATNVGQRRKRRATKSRNAA